MLKTQVKRKGQWTPIPKRERDKARRSCCSCCSAEYGQMISFDSARMFYTAREHLDHMIPRRWLAEHGIYEHDYRGLASICSRCHGRKKSLEDRLFQGDVFSFMEGLKAMNYPLDDFLRFASQLGLREFDGWRLGR